MTNQFSSELCNEIHSYLNEHNLKKPTKVQSETIGPLLNKESVNVLAPTGTGKTLAFGLPLFHNLKEEEQERQAIESHPRAIILAPTKELAKQIYSVMKEVSHHCKQRVRLLLGGESGAKSSALAKEKIDILVAGPGRLLSMLKNKELKGEHVTHLIIDEADQLFDQGFFKEIEEIYNFMEWSICKVQLFSATKPNGIEDKLSEVFKKQEFKAITVEGTHHVKVEIETFNVQLHYKEKYPMLRTFLDREKKGSGIIFVNQFDQAEFVGKKLKEDYPQMNIYMLHGKLPASEREALFDDFRKRGGILVATDIVARGVDIQSLQWVLNYDLPYDAIYYLHRAGRVGRNGRSGRVFNFVTAKDAQLIRNINQAIKGEGNLKIGMLTGSKPKKAIDKRKPSAAKRVVSKKPARGEVAKSRSATTKKTPRYKRK